MSFMVYAKAHFRHASSALGSMKALEKNLVADEPGKGVGGGLLMTISVTI